MKRNLAAKERAEDVGAVGFELSTKCIFNNMRSADEQLQRPRKAAFVTQAGRKQRARS